MEEMMRWLGVKRTLPRGAEGQSIERVLSLVLVWTVSCLVVSERQLYTAGASALLLLLVLGSGGAVLATCSCWLLLGTAHKHAVGHAQVGVKLQSRRAGTSVGRQEGRKVGKHVLHEWVAIKHSGRCLQSSSHSVAGHCRRGGCRTHLLSRQLVVGKGVGRSQPLSHRQACTSSSRNIT